MALGKHSDLHVVVEWKEKIEEPLGKFVVQKEVDVAGGDPGAEDAVLSVVVSGAGCGRR